MYYNLILFGERIHKLRKRLRLTQEAVSELSGVNVESVKRLEKGKVTPKLDTLEKLSPVLKHDLNAILLEYRVDDFSKYSEVKEKLETKFDSDESTSLDVELKELLQLAPTIKNSFYKAQTEQLILLTKGVILYKKEHNPYLALETLVSALKVSTPNFNVYRYKSFVYSPVDIRILMNIGFVFHKLENHQMYLNIMKFCLEIVDDDHEIYPKLCHNLAGVFRRKKDYNKALYYSDLGIDYCYKNKNLKGLYFLYYGKGVSEFYLDNPEHIQSFKKAISICDLFQQYKLKKSMIKNCYENYGIKF